MKINNILSKTLSVSLIAAFVAACQPEEFDSPSEANLALASEYEDAITVNVTDSNYVYFSFDESRAKGIIPVWIIEGAYSTGLKAQHVYPKAGDYTVEVKISNANGLSDGSIKRTFNIEKSIMTGFAGFKADSEYNMWNKANISSITYYYAPGWNQISDPNTDVKGGSYRVPLPSATTDQWQAQMAFHTDLATSAENNYDFSVIFTSTTEHPGVTVKLTSEASDDVYFFAEKIALKANTPTCFWMSDMKGVDISQIKLVLDFGGNADNTTVTIENIVLKNHADDDGTIVPIKEDDEQQSVIWCDENSADNLWNAATRTYEYYYAPGWSQIADPVVEEKDNSYIVKLPSATTDQWQAQMKMHTSGFSTSADKNYDFKVVLNSNNSFNGVTVKFVDQTDDANSYTDARIALNAYEDYTFTAINVEGKDIANLDLVLDFGGCPDNTEITISGIIVQEHNGPKQTSWVSVDSNDNLWHVATRTYEYYYAPGWSQIADPVVEEKNNSYIVKLPSATSDQWQAQMKIHTSGLSTSADKKYSVRLVLNSNNSFNGITVKFVDQTDDANYYTDARIEMTAYEDYTFKSEYIEGKDIANLDLVLDFGGCPDNTEITISDIIVQVVE